MLTVYTLRRYNFITKLTYLLIIVRNLYHIRYWNGALFLLNSTNRLITSSDVKLDNKTRI